MSAGVSPIPMPLLEQNSSGFRETETTSAWRVTAQKPRLDSVTPKSGGSWKLIAGFAFLSFAKVIARRWGD
jgi:hypothetical protein